MTLNPEPRPMPNGAESLFRPFESEKLSLRNRVVMAPMSRCFSPGGILGGEMADYYRRRAEGGVSLIVTEGTWIPHPSAGNDENIPNFYGEASLAAWAQVVKSVHSAGGKVFPQLFHVGLVEKPELENINYATPDDPSTKISPSGIRDGRDRIGKPATRKEIDAVIEAYAAAAATAQRLGFDGVELHGAHGYLIDQFLWTATNERTDSFGGDLSGRLRFVCDVVREIRSRTGSAFPIALRFSQWKVADYSAKLAATPKELEALLAPIADAGVDIFHCSQRRFWEPEFEGSPLNLAGWAKKLVGKTTISVGSVGLNGDFMTGWSGVESEVQGIEQLLLMMDRGDFDLVAVGRALLADPLWLEKIKRGATSELEPFDATKIATLY